MIFEFVSPHWRLNLVSFTVEKRKKVVPQTRLTTTEAAEIFEYEKNNNRYRDRIKFQK